ncbi:MAG: hypothetical protein APF81_16580 [Desulfosporosinus sp. BRH_c37]|nr:MAG: hypothetical protein APF81_16580 [Desulfosporosinus sp. BRH_c37]
MLNKRKSLSVISLVIILAFSLILSGCSQKAESKGEQSKPPIVIGVIEPLSGPVAGSGQNVVWGAEYAVKFINEDGGINGRQVQLKTYDSKNDPAEAVNVANKLINNDNVKVIMGAWGSSPTLAVLPIIEKAGVPLVVETASSPKVTNSGFKYVFRVSPTSDQEAAGAQDALISKVGVKKAAIIAVNNDWGKGGAAAYTNVLKEKGAEVVSTEFVADNSTDFYPQLTKIKNSEADTIIINSEVSQISLIIKQVKELKMTQKIVTTGGSNFSDALLEIAKDAAEGVYSVQQNVAWIPDMTPNPTRAKKFNEAWNADKKPHIGILEGAKGFDGIYTISEALKKAGTSEDSQKIQQALKEVQFDGIGLSVKFDEKGQSQIKDFLVQVVQGKTQLVK